MPSTPKLVRVAPWRLGAQPGAMPTAPWPYDTIGHPPAGAGAVG